MQVQIKNTMFRCIEGNQQSFLMMLLNIKQMFGRVAVETVLKLFGVDETKAKRLSAAMP